MIRDIDGNELFPGDLIERVYWDNSARKNNKLVLLDANLEMSCFHGNFLLKVMALGETRPGWLYSDRVRKI